MAPLIYGIGALTAGVLGYFRYEQIKRNDLVQFKTDELPGVIQTIKVTGVAGNSITGTLIAEVGGISQDTRVPITIDKKNVVKNLSPRLW